MAEISFISNEDLRRSCRGQTCYRVIRESRRARRQHVTIVRPKLIAWYIAYHVAWHGYRNTNVNASKILAHILKKKTCPFVHRETLFHHFAVEFRGNIFSMPSTETHRYFIWRKIICSAGSRVKIGVAKEICSAVRIQLLTYLDHGVSSAFLVDRPLSLLLHHRVRLGPS